MKVVQINAVSGTGSTGKIVLSISEILSKHNIENYIFYSSKKSNYALSTKYIGDFSIKINALKSRLLGNWGFNTRSATKRLINELKRIEPDIVHLHNLHAHNVNLSLLFDYFKQKNTKIFWTFHDCWAFTGYCTHFQMVDCNKWQDYCNSCILKKKYSWFFDKSKFLYNKKKQLFSDLNLTIITPSIWMANLVKKSFLSNYTIKVINNGVDLNIFKPTNSDIREKYNIKNKYVILGVAFEWNDNKGLDVFIELSKKLSKKYEIILVGVSDKLKKKLPDRIIGISKTNSQVELAQFYSMADVFVNPTREDTFPTVNIESIACGTPVVSFKTGGSPEILDNTCGIVVEKNDTLELERAVKYICINKPFSVQKCVTRAKSFNKDEKFLMYLKLYKGEL